ALDEEAENNDLECLTKDKFLSWQVLCDTWGWLLSSFVKVYKNETEYPNSVFTIEPHFDKSPLLTFGIHLYTKGSVPEKHNKKNHGWVYSHRRVHEQFYFSREQSSDVFISKPMKKSSEYPEEHKDFIVFVFKEIPLLNLTKINLKSNIFDKDKIERLYKIALTCSKSDNK
ncbi:MAG: hypothetical protein AB8H03_16770, partial [Saprospiraceae bacterium]